MIKFDNRFENIEDYLLNIYSQFTHKFVDSCKKHPETNGHTFEEIKQICPEVYSTFKDTCDFLYYTEKFLDYKLTDDHACFEYIG